MRIVMVGEGPRQRGGIGTYVRMVVDSAPPEVQVKHICTYSNGGPLHRLLAFLMGWCRLLLVSWTRRVDVVHVLLSDGGSLLRKALIISCLPRGRCAVVLHFHGPEPDKRFPLSRIVGRLVRKALCSADALMALNEHWARWYVDEWGAQRVFVLGNPAPVVAVPEKPSGGKIVIVALGRLGERKGTYFLVDAFAKLSVSARRTARLVLAGDGDTPSVSERATQLGIGHLVSVRGWLDSDERDAILESSHVIVMPSRAEGQPFGLLEAMAWGLAPIASRVDGMDELIVNGWNGLLVEPGSGVQLAGAMERLVTDSSLRESYGVRAAATASDRDVKAHWDRLLSIYSEARAE